MLTDDGEPVEGWFSWLNEEILEFLPRDFQLDEGGHSFVLSGIPLNEGAFTAEPLHSSWFVGVDTGDIGSTDAATRLVVNPPGVTVVVPSADLGVHFVEGITPAKASPGEQFPVEIAFGNAGPSSIESAALVIQLPGGLTFGGMDHSNVYNPAAGTVVVSFGPLGPGESVSTGVFNLLVDPDATFGMVKLGTYACPVNPDPIVANNTDDLFVLIDGPPDPFASAEGEWAPLVDAVFGEK
jgi:hypothetical protein